MLNIRTVRSPTLCPPGMRKDWLLLTKQSLSLHLYTLYYSHIGCLQQASGLQITQPLYFSLIYDQLCSEPHVPVHVVYVVAAEKAVKVRHSTLIFPELWTSLWMKKKESCFDFLPRQKMTAESIILQFTLGFKMIMCCTERQIEVMLLTFITKGGVDLQDFKGFHLALSLVTNGW